MAVENEAELIERARAGDGCAFGALVEAYERALFNVAFRMVGNYHDAQDLTQGALVKAYQHLAGYDRRSGFYSWIVRIVINESINWLKHRKHEQPVEAELVATDRGPEERWRDQELSDTVQHALMELSMDYRQVIVLRHFLQLSYREMSEALAIPEKTVKSRLFTARQRLGGILSRRRVETS